MTQYRFFNLEREASSRFQSGVILRPSARQFIDNALAYVLGLGQNLSYLLKAFKQVKISHALRSLSLKIQLVLSKLVL
jgi:hypothetical protein